MNLLVDTGSNALVVFADRVNAGNTDIARSSEAVSKAYASGTRSGMLATAPVRIGPYQAQAMRIMLVDSPDSLHDPSLTAKQADGIIGLRRTEGLTFKQDHVALDAPLSALLPAVNRFELDVPPSGLATLSFGTMPTLDQVDPRRVFKAKTLAHQDSTDKFNRSYADLQVPFRAQSSVGKVDGPDLDVLLDTGAVSKLVLDSAVAAQLGYDAATQRWKTADIELSFTAPYDTLTLPRFKTSDISVAPYREMGAAFEAVLGISHWQNYVVGFSFTHYASGGPDGTLMMLARSQLNDIQAVVPPASVNGRYADVSGLNSFGDERFPSLDHSGQRIAFEADRPDGVGGNDVYLWQAGQGLVTLPGLNSAADDGHPVLSDDGSYLTFHSNRAGQYDLYVYDLTARFLIPLPAFSSPNQHERNPSLSRDLHYLAYTTENLTNGQAEIRVYDIRTNQFVDLPGLHSGGAENNPNLSADGSLLVFERNGSIQLYDLTDKTFLDAATDFAVEAQVRKGVPALSPDGALIAFQSNKQSPLLGADGFDVVVTSDSGLQRALPGLNASNLDGAPQFSGDGEWLVFHSERAGGQGSSDIYLYRLNDYAQSLPATNVSPTDFPLAKTPAGRLVVQAQLGGKTLNLLLDTGTRGIVLFQDKLSQPFAGSLTDEAFNWTLPGGAVLLGKVGKTTLTLPGRGAFERTVGLVKSSDYAARLGETLEGIDGVFGLRYSAMDDGSAALDPVLPVSMLELNPDPAGQAGLSLGKMPLMLSANQERVFYDGQELSGDFYGDLGLAGWLSTDAQQTEQFRLLPSTVLTDAVLLDTGTAAELGYNAASASWGGITALSLHVYFQWSLAEQVLPPIPVENIKVVDLSSLQDPEGSVSPYKLVLGLKYWQHWVIAYDSLSRASGGPRGNVAVIDRRDLPAASSGSTADTALPPYFVQLPAGINTPADEMLGDFCDQGFVFQTNRKGYWEVYLYRVQQGLDTLDTLNSSLDGELLHPSISADCRYIAFESVAASGDSEDVFVFDTLADAYVDLPGLNSDGDEEAPYIDDSAARLAFFRCDPDASATEGCSLKLHLYDLSAKQALTIPPGLTSSSGNELFPSLSGNLLAFQGQSRPDNFGNTDVFLYDLSAQSLLTLPNWINHSLAFKESSAPALSPEGRYLAFQTDLRDWQMAHMGRDIYVIDRDNNEALFLPGLNSAFEDSDPSLYRDGQYLLFHSKRPQSQGGYDLFVYARNQGQQSFFATTEAYIQEGVVQDEAGRPLPFTTVSAIDGQNNTLTTATSDAQGRFRLTIPTGVPLPIRFEASQGQAVTDQVGDDTYLPAFSLGDIKFSQVWVEDKAESGMSTTLKFDIDTTEPKYNTDVVVYLKKLEGNATDLNLDGFEPDYTLATVRIEKIGHGGAETQPLVTSQNDMRTTIGYSNDTRSAHVEHSFIVPQIPQGTYAVVFKLVSENTGTQGEAVTDLSNNLMSPGSMIIGNPDKPNLRILYTGLTSNAFVLPAQRPDDTLLGAPDRQDLQLSLEVESMAQDTVEPVDIRFALDIGGTRYPLTFRSKSASGALVKSDVYTYAKHCVSEEQPGGGFADHCAALFRQDQQGRTYDFYLNAAAYDALAAKISDTPVNLIVSLDPDNRIVEWQDNKSDNVKSLALMYLAGNKAANGRRTAEDEEEESCSSAYAKYPVMMVCAVANGEDGNPENVKAGYEFGPVMSYRNDTIYGVTIPTAFQFELKSNIWAQLLNKDPFDILRVEPTLDFDIDNIPGSQVDFVVNMLGQQVFSLKDELMDRMRKSCEGSTNGQNSTNAQKEKCVSCGRGCESAFNNATQNLDASTLPPKTKGWITQSNRDAVANTPLGKAASEYNSCQVACSKSPFNIFSTKDKDGGEKFSKSKQVGYKYSFMTTFSIPLAVEVGIEFEGGLRGTADFLANNNLVLAAGPYLSASGYLEGSFDVVGINAGVGISLTVIDATLTAKPSVQILPSYPLAALRFDMPLVLESLSGEAYVFIKAATEMLWKYTFANWDGVSMNIATVPQLLYALGSYNEYKVNIKDANERTLSLPMEMRRMAAISLANWGNAPTPKFASWEGMFQFEGLRYYTVEEITDSGVSFETFYGDDFNFYTQGGGKLTAKVDKNDDGEFGDDEVIFDGVEGQAMQPSTIPRGLHRVSVEWENTDPNNTSVNFYWNTPKLQFETTFANGQVAGQDMQKAGVVKYREVTPALVYRWDVDKPIIDSKTGASLGTMPSQTGPKEGVITENNFMMQSNGRFPFKASEYFFEITTNNYSALYIDDTSYAGSPKTQFGFTGTDPYVGYGWYDHRGVVEKHLYQANMSEGEHTVRIDHAVKRLPDQIAVTWMPHNAFRAQYFNTSSRPKPEEKVVGEGFVSADAQGHFVQNWNELESPPGANLDFAVRWEGMFDFEEGDYTFLLNVDDMGWMRIDDDEVFSSSKQGKYAYTATKHLSAGLHKITLEMVDKVAHAQIDLAWVNTSTPGKFTAAFYPSSEFDKLLKAKVDLGGTTDLSAVMNNPVSPPTPKRVSTEDLKDFTLNNPNDPTPIPFKGISHDWGIDPPITWMELDYDHFSVRYEGAVEFDASGTYEFYSYADDYIRVWLDGVIVLDSWENASENTRNRSNMIVVPVSAGIHQLRVDYRDVSVSANFKLGWRPVSAGMFHGVSFNGKNFGENAGVGGVQDPTRTSTGTRIDSTAMPDSSIWSGVFNFAPGVYRFHAVADETLQAWVDGVQVHNITRSTQGYVVSSKPIHLSAGDTGASTAPHVIRLKHTKGGSGRLLFYWEKVQPLAANELWVSYYTNADFDRLLTNPSDPPAARGSTSRRLSTIIELKKAEDVAFPDRRGVMFTGDEVHYGNGAPPAMGADDFTVRYEGEITFTDSSNALEFFAYADNRIRIWLDGKPILDNWDGNADNQTLMTVIPPQTPGTHHLVVDYRELGGEAAYRFGWRPVYSGQFHGLIFEDEKFGSGNWFGNLGSFSDTVRQDGLVFAYDAYGTLPGIKTKDFSAIWSGAFYFAEGEYDFSYLVDDQLEVRLDNTLWLIAPASTTQQTRANRIEGGWHSVQVKYRDTGHDAKLLFLWGALKQELVMHSISGTIRSGSSVCLSDSDGGSLKQSACTSGDSTQQLRLDSDGYLTSRRTDTPACATSYGAGNTLWFHGCGANPPMQQWQLVPIPNSPYSLLQLKSTAGKRLQSWCVTAEVVYFAALTCQKMPSLQKMASFFSSPRNVPCLLSNGGLLPRWARRR